MSATWLPEPPAGTQVCLGFDGSETGDFTAIKGRTLDGLLFTPRWLERPTIWDPADHGGRMPRNEVDAAVDALFDRFDVARMYCDPPLWGTEIERWALRHGDRRVVKWETYRAVPMHTELERFVVDVSAGRLRHDGCPITTAHVRNARMAHRRDSRYVLSKPHDLSRKIDAAMASVLAHAAACDAEAAGWGQDSGDDLPDLVFGL